MLRVKKITDAIFPRDFTIALQSCKEVMNPLLKKHKEQINIIEQHFQEQLQNLKQKVEVEIYPRELIDFKSDFYNSNPYTFAKKNNLDYQLHPLEIKEIKRSITKLPYITKKAQEEINKIMNKKKIEKINNKFITKFKQLEYEYPITKDYIFEDTKKSIAFEKKYINNYEKYATDFDLELDSLDDLPYSQYAFIYESDPEGKKNIPFLKNEALPESYNGKRYILDIDTKQIKKNKPQVIQYYPKFENTVFFLYKKCLYQVDFDEFFTDEDFMLQVKGRIYKEDEKYQNLKKQIELYEDSGKKSKKKREPIPDEVKTIVWNRDGGRCVKCGSQENLEFDHIIPFSKGGSSTARNLQLLCQNCNRHKSDKI